MNVRDAFFNEVEQMVRQGEDIVIVSADLGAPSLDVFRRDFPQRFVSVGIAEQNLLAVACGLSLAGKHVIAFGLNPFPVTRAFDQLRTLVCGLRIPVTIAALNAGTCSAECGYTHMPVEDLSLLRTLPNIRYVNPSDTEISRQAARQLVMADCPVLIRFDKQIQSETAAGEVSFQLGFNVHRQSEDYAVLTTGYFVPVLSGIEMTVRGRKVCPTVIDCYSFPLDEAALIKEISGYKQIATLEDHVLPGGLGSLVLEMLSDAGQARNVHRLGLPVDFLKDRKLSNRASIHRDLGLDKEHLADTLGIAFEGGLADE